MAGLRTISPDEVAKILQAHEKWLESDGKEGEKADLSFATFPGVNFNNCNLQKVNFKGADLSDMHLQKAHLENADLSEAKLDGAELAGAFLSSANLSGASLIKTRLNESQLDWANLSGRTNLSGAVFVGCYLDHANLSGAGLIGAVFTKADLTWSDLSGTELNEAHFDEANLTNANLSGASLLSAELNGAQLQKAVLRDANLQQAQLLNAKGLLAEQLGGTNVLGATLPEDIAKFELLPRIDELSKSAKRIFLAMLLACAYAALTVFSATDVSLLTDSASSPLPIIQTVIPIVGFFGVAPAILFAIYLYFHLYLQRLWNYLAKMPAVFPDGIPLDEKVYPWLLNGLVRSHFMLLKENRPPLSLLQNLISSILAWWVVPFTIGLFWLRNLPRHEWVGTGFHMGFLVLSVVAAIWFQQLAKATLRGHQRENINFKGNWRSVKPYMQAAKRTRNIIGIGAAVILFTLVISDGAINGRPSLASGMAPHPRCLKSHLSQHLRELIPTLLSCIGARAFADLTEQDVSTKPSNWFIGDKKLTQIVSGAQLNGANLQHALAISAFLVKADLRGANLHEAEDKGESRGR